jgi:hypothetical protein
MKPEKQRIAIAEACGYERLTQYEAVWRHKGSKIYTAGNLPNYLNDLNAMAEAENLVLKSAQQCRDYADFLDDGNGGHFATSAQRAEAFLRTVGKWEES